MRSSDLGGALAPAQGGGPEVGTTKCGRGTEVGMAVERDGIPVGVLADAANVGEPDLGERVVTHIPPEVESPAGVPVVAGRGFGRDGRRDDLADVGLRLVAPHRGNRKRPSRNDGRRMRRSRRRSIAARTLGWRHSDRRLLVRHEHYPFIYDGVLHRACALIAIGRF